MFGSWRSRADAPSLYVEELELTGGAPIEPFDGRPLEAQMGMEPPDLLRGDVYYDKYLDRWFEYDDSDEEEHFREMVRLRIRHEERFRDVHDVNVPEHRPPDPIWGEPPRTAGAAPRSPDSDVDENTDPWGDFGASP